jgi:hypothetical protein
MAYAPPPKSGLGFIDDTGLHLSAADYSERQGKLAWAVAGRLGVLRDRLEVMRHGLCRDWLSSR